MKLLPVLALSSLVSSFVWGAIQPTDGAPPRLTAADQSFLREGGFDPKVVSPAAFRGAQDDPESFLKRNRGAYDRFVEWRQDPALMLEAERTKPGSAEKALRQMGGFLRPEQLAPLWSSLKLAPRGVNAEVPEVSALDPDRTEAAPGRGAVEGGEGPQTTSGAPAVPAPPGLHTGAPPAPSGPPQRQATGDGPAGGGAGDFTDWFCRRFGCVRT